ncbi:MAG: hypothetical protein M3Z03_14905 [Actinomycetota bacterium]|nr:hypothetical protein [Actinomycetota bacterium]
MIVPALVAAAVLAYAGGAKVLDPTMTVGALRAMGLPSSPTLVRVGATAELILGVTAVAVGGSALWLLVALSYAAFTAFVMVALRSGRPIGSCGCFGRDDTPPAWWHAALTASAAAAVAAYALG